MRRISSLLAARAASLLILAAIAGPVQAQAPATSDTKIAGNNTELAGKFQIDTAIPQTAGFSVIGVTPTEVVDPAATRVSLLSIPSYLDKNNHLKPGVALGGSPFWWFNDMTLDQYRAAGTLTHILGRTEVSVGFADGGDANPDHLGLGFSTELLGAADYRLDPQLYNCTGQALQTMLEPVISKREITGSEARAQALKEWDDWINKRAHLPLVKDPSMQSPLPDDKVGWVAARQDDLINEKTTVAVAAVAKADAGSFEKARTECVDAATKRYAQRRSLQIAGGVAERLVDGKPGKTHEDGGSVWIAYRQPFHLGAAAPNYWSIFGRHDFSKREDLGGGLTQTYDKSTLALIVGYEAGSSKLSLQGGWEKVDYRSPGPNKDDDYGFYTLSYDYKLSDNTWIALKAGSKGDTKSVTNKKNEYFLVDVRWAPPKK